MNNKIVKGILLMIGVIFTALQAGNIVWAATIISAVCVGLGYFVKNVWFQSASEDGVFDWKDAVSAVILAIVTTIGGMVSELVTGDGVIDWILLLKTIGTVVITYFTATFFEPAKK
jgi:membrane protease YdiL (CAAX protease family)